MTALQLRMGNCADVIFASQAGLLSWRSCYPFAVLGAPFSVLGGATDLSPTLYQPTVGVLLLVASVQMIRFSIISRTPGQQGDSGSRSYSLP